MIIGVSGHGRHVGKSSVVASLLAALPRRDWIAIKVSSHFHHGAAGADGQDYVIFEEPRGERYNNNEPAGDHSVILPDTARFLRAGAQRAFLIQASATNVATAVTTTLGAANAAASSNVIIEGNTIFDVMRPDLHIMVVNYGIAEFKESARRLLPRVDALLVVGKGGKGGEGDKGGKDDKGKSGKFGKPDRYPAWEHLLQAVPERVPRFVSDTPLPHVNCAMLARALCWRVTRVISWRNVLAYDDPR